MISKPISWGPSLPFSLWWGGVGPDWGQSPVVPCRSLVLWGGKQRGHYLYCFIVFNNMGLRDSSWS